MDTNHLTVYRKDLKKYIKTLSKCDLLDLQNHNDNSFQFS